MEEKSNNKGYIYIITNDINDYVYIGQTTKTIEERFRIHIKDSEQINGKSKDFHIYRAMRKYGVEHFSIHLLEECDINKLNEREIFYIQKYNSYNKGYNSTLGGGGKKTLSLEEKTIIREYKRNHSITSIAQKYHCSRYTIRQILLKNNIHIISNEEKGLDISCLDKDNNIVAQYPTLSAAARDMKTKIGNNQISLYTIINNIKNHIILKTPYLGYYWASPKLSQKDIKQRRKKIYNKWHNRQPQIYKPKYNICPICKKKKYITSNLCQECKKIEQRDIALKELKTKISKKDLKKKILEKPFTQIAKEYNVSSTTIKHWCELYNLPTKASDIKLLTKHY